ncbi:23S rRNA pseudouridine2605 synthase [bacterium A37T11]|nr:23S rRNA pseudouridine2605 synthase [bacterium A37T11]
MPFSNKRNSREDKSGKAGRPGFRKRVPGERINDRDNARPASGDDTEDRNRPFSTNKPFDRGNKPYDKNKKVFDRITKPFEKSSKPFDRTSKSFDRNSKPFERSNKPLDKNRSQGAGDKPYQKDRIFDKDKPFNRNSDKPVNRDRSFSKDTPYNKDKHFNKDKSFSKDRPYRQDKPYAKEGVGRKRTVRSDDREEKRFAKEREDNGMIRLNRYIANSGICSRRKADELIEAGVVSVNGVVVSELGTKVDPMKDEIRYNGERLKREKMVYVLLNKPKDYITTTEDPQERRTVMNLVDKATRERIYPVGRLDRNTTGLLLMTNDGDLAEKLSHPRNSITKIYQVELNKNLTQGDFNKIEFGLTLEDGLIKPDSLSYVQGGSKKDIGIQIHSGKNRIVRRIFEHLGYDVVKLDRVIYANLTKKDLPRGRWRYLEEKEIIQLKHFIK